MDNPVTKEHLTALLPLTQPSPKGEENILRGGQSKAARQSAELPKCFPLPGERVRVRGGERRNLWRQGI